MATFPYASHLTFQYLDTGPTILPLDNFSNVNGLSNLVDDVDSDNDIDGHDYYINDGITYSGHTISINGNDYAIFGTPGAALGIFQGFIPYDPALDDLSILHGSPVVQPITPVPGDAVVVNCFLSDTMIATPDGERKIKDLKIGDVVTTAEGRSAMVRWVAKQTVNNLPWLNSKAEPVCIKQNAFGQGSPSRDLIVSADHGMVLENCLVNAGALVNGTSVVRIPLSEMPDTFTYWHIETDAHETILANGAASETFCDYRGRAAFDNYQNYLDRYGAERLIHEMDLPRISSARLLTPALCDLLGLRVTGQEYTSKAS